MWYPVLGFQICLKWSAGEKGIKAWVVISCDEDGFGRLHNFPQSCCQPEAVPGTKTRSAKFHGGPRERRFSLFSLSVIPWGAEG